MLTDQKKQDIIQSFMQKSREEWDTLPQQLQLSDGDLCELNDWAMSRGVMHVELAEYLGFRGGYGCGDHGHEEALRGARSRRRRVRTALGYLYP